MLKTTRLGACALAWGFCVASALAEPPKLVVAVIVDQMRYDYLERFQALLKPDGFRLLAERGAFMTFARYNYCPTVTGPGHASYLSGSTPSLNGIVANEWFDRSSGKPMYCVEDPSVEGVGVAGSKGKMSPRNLIGGTVADQMRLQFRSKVVSLSLKDRGAILPAGKKPLGAYWNDSRTGDFVTSTYYTKELPAWVRRFNERKRAASFVGQTWNRLLDEKEYPYPDDGPGEGTLGGESKPVFPHAIEAGKGGGYDFLGPTPYGNQIVEEFAEAAVEGEGLGGGEQPDLLCISFSSVDGCGHVFGPYSQEVQDIMLRLDAQISSLFQFLDRKIGMGRVMVVLTADHGVAPNPEFAAAEGLDGRRLDEAGLMKELAAKIEARFGAGDWVQAAMGDGNIYLNRAVLQAKGLSSAEVAAFVRDAAYETGKIEAGFTRDQLLDGRAPGLLGAAVLNGFHPERSGDVILIPKPFFVPSGGRTGTTHGSPYHYDTHVPVLFYGAAFRPGRYADEFYITDVAPTLSAALHLESPPACMGKPFVKALLAP